MALGSLAMARARGGGRLGAHLGGLLGAHAGREGGHRQAELCAGGGVGLLGDGSRQGVAASAHTLAASPVPMWGVRTATAWPNWERVVADSALGMRSRAVPATLWAPAASTRDARAVSAFNNSGWTETAVSLAMV